MANWLSATAASSEVTTTSRQRSSTAMAQYPPSLQASMTCSKVGSTEIPAATFTHTYCPVWSDRAPSCSREEGGPLAAAWDEIRAGSLTLSIPVTVHPTSSARTEQDWYDPVEGVRRRGSV